jgi:hypothetical protein
LAENTIILEKRKELKNQLTPGNCKTLVDILLDGTGRIIQKITHSPKAPRFWFNALVLTLATLAVGLFVSVLLSEFHKFRGELVPLELMSATLILFGMIATKIITNAAMITWRDKIVDAIEKIEDLEDVEQILALAFSVKLPLLLSIIYAVVSGVVISINIAIAKGGYAGIGYTVGAIIRNFLGGTMIYLLFIFFQLPVRMSKYQIRLFGDDPSSSEVVDHLSDIVNTVVYTVAIFAAVSTIIFGLIDILTLANALLMIVIFWVPLTVLFIVNHYAMSKIISRAKWHKLNEIQERIINIEQEQDIADDDTIDAINRLLDYHERVLASRNSVFNFRAGLRFLNSLLFPIVGFILANVDAVLNLITRWINILTR